MRIACVLACLVLCACGGAPFTMQPAADDGGQTLVVTQDDGGDGGLMIPPPDAGNMLSTHRDAHAADASPPFDALPPADASEAGADAAPECTPGAGRCVGLGAELCNSSGYWGAAVSCEPHGCTAGSCGQCVPGTTQCSAGTIAVCAPWGLWGSPVACPSVCECYNGNAWVPWSCTQSCPSSSASTAGSCASATACM